MQQQPSQTEPPRKELQTRRSYLFHRSNFKNIKRIQVSIRRTRKYDLQLIVRKLKSYIKDTTDILNKLEENIKSLPNNSILVTLDVVSLYTNILHKEGINDVAKGLEKEDTKTIPTRVIVKFLSLICTTSRLLTKTTYKSKDVRLERNAHQPTATSTWVHLKKTTSTRSLRIISHATTDLLMTSFYLEQFRNRS